MNMCTVTTCCYNHHSPCVLQQTAEGAVQQPNPVSGAGVPALYAALQHTTDIKVCWVMSKYSHWVSDGQWLTIQTDHMLTSVTHSSPSGPLSHLDHITRARWLKDPRKLPQNGYVFPYKLYYNVIMQYTIIASTLPFWCHNYSFT